MPQESRRVSIFYARSLWIVLATVAIFLAAGVSLGVPIIRQHSAVREIERVGGTVQMRPRGPAWLRGVLGDKPLDGFDEVFDVRLDDSRANDTTLYHVGRIASLRRLSIGTTTQVTDMGVEHLSGLTNLEYLFLGNPSVTDVGIAHLDGMRRLRDLSLANTQITNEGLAHLKRFPKLEWLSLSNTQVSDAGVEHLKALTLLQGLFLANTNLTAGAVAELQRAIPGLKIVT